jgi:hypothetical protein
MIMMMITIMINDDDDDIHDDGGDYLVKQTHPPFSPPLQAKLEGIIIVFINHDDGIHDHGIIMIMMTMIMMMM